MERNSPEQKHMVIIYHNPRCAKSRCALEILLKKKINFSVVEYLKNPPSEKELKTILKKLGIKAEEIIRKKEPLFKKKFNNRNFSGTQWLKILSENPILIERPIVVKENKAVVARPPEKVNSILV